ncbi:hypothetical protein [Nocardia rhamnosiphila]|uniref:hypothetical protein n=1 Tax=Nocardia rhamnosiphila TaxID=426716 RepID=UPI0004C417AB|nr:hypothetical protein [Nocardia rhamnosiphila]
MPKRISDVSLHVYVTPEILDDLVDTVRAELDEHLGDGDICAWRFTLPVAEDDSRHREFDSRWRTANPGAQPQGHATFEIALSLAGDPAELTDGYLAALEHRLLRGLDAHGPGAPFTFSAEQRTDLGREPLLPERL